MPRLATTHIQNTAPGPPRVIATATPAMLPVPTRLARLTDSACNGEMPSASGSPRPSVQRIISGKCRIWMKPSRSVKNTPTASRP